MKNIIATVVSPVNGNATYTIYNQLGCTGPAISGGTGGFMISGGYGSFKHQVPSIGPDFSIRVVDMAGCVTCMDKTIIPPPTTTTTTTTAPPPALEENIYGGYAGTPDSLGYSIVSATLTKPLPAGESITISLQVTAQNPFGTLLTQMAVITIGPNLVIASDTVTFNEDNLMIVNVCSPNMDYNGDTFNMTSSLGAC